MVKKRKRNNRPKKDRKIPFYVMLNKDQQDLLYGEMDRLGLSGSAIGRMAMLEWIERRRAERVK